MPGVKNKGRCIVVYEIGYTLFFSSFTITVIKIKVSAEHSAVECSMPKNVMLCLIGH